MTSAGCPGAKLQQVEEKVHFCILDELQRSVHKCRRTSEEEAAVVKAQDDKNQNLRLLLEGEQTYPPDVL